MLRILANDETQICEAQLLPRSCADQSHYECDDLVTTLKQCVSLSPELVAL